MRSLKLIIFLFFLALLLGGLMLFFNHQQQATELIIDPKIPLALAEDLVIREYDKKSGCTFVLNAKNVKVPQHSPDMICNNATVIMTKDDRIMATLNVTQATVNRDHNIITCSQSITGSMDGMTFSTTTCHYTFSTKILEIPGMFELVSKEARTIAPQATINMETGSITCSKGIKTELLITSKRSGCNNRR